MSTTITSTLTRTSRRGSISLIAYRPKSIIFTLPAELILKILDIATSIDFAKSPFALARVCKTISQFIDHILYRTIVLNSPKTISLFFRTTTTKPASFLSEHVKRISVTATGHLHSRIKVQLLRIIDACTGVQTMALAHRSHSDTIRLPSVCASELILESYVDLSKELTFDQTPNPLSSVTRLRICEPGSQWVAPSSTLRPFITNLTHLQLCRRAPANEENDITFLDDLRSLFLFAPKLNMVVVSVFPPYFADGGESVKRSYIWRALEVIQEQEERLYITEGNYGSWIHEWKDPEASASPAGPPNFWLHVARNATKAVKSQ